MADYEKMYALLVGAVDEVIDDLKRVPMAEESAEKLEKALLDAEEMYIESEDGGRESSGISSVSCHFITLSDSSS